MIAKVFLANTDKLISLMNRGLMEEMMTAKKRNEFQVALLFKARGSYGREIIAGVCDYVKSTRAVWDMLLHEDFRDSVAGIADWSGNGIIADFDDPEFVKALSEVSIPVIGVGGSYHRDADYPRNFPYVATDNEKLVTEAYTHLVDMGLPRFAFYGLPETRSYRWSEEREKAYLKLCARDRAKPEVFKGQGTFGPDWDDILADVIAWLKGLPKPIGVIAVTDSRARHILQACILADIAVPEQVSIVGIDDDPLLRMLTRIPISSVRQGTRIMGRTAAAMLHRRLIGATLDETRVIVPPEGLNAQMSSRYQPIYDPYVMRARHYIRQFAGQGIKVAQVAAYVGVSRTTLETHFRRTFGYTVHDDMLAYRLQLAQEMLGDESLPLERVAELSGFNNSQYMHTVFKRELGCSPREYQRNSFTR
jgi:LacI family transcriptional regulator